VTAAHPDSADAPGEGGFAVMVAAPCSGRGRPVMQEAAAAAFRRGSRASALDGMVRKAL